MCVENCVQIYRHLIVDRDIVEGMVHKRYLQRTQNLGYVWGSVELSVFTVY